VRGSGRDERKRSDAGDERESTHRLLRREGEDRRGEESERERSGDGDERERERRVRK
jgi:hypothetical protein